VHALLSVGLGPADRSTLRGGSLGPLGVAGARTGGVTAVLSAGGAPASLLGQAGGILLGLLSSTTRLPRRWADLLQAQPGDDPQPQHILLIRGEGPEEGQHAVGGDPAEGFPLDVRECRPAGKWTMAILCSREHGRGTIGRSGLWRSLVAHGVWDAGVAGSNPASPTATILSGVRGCSSVVEPQPSKLVTGVRFPSPAPLPP
jgi:hypothetical protein